MSKPQHAKGLPVDTSAGLLNQQDCKFMLVVQSVQFASSKQHSFRPHVPLYSFETAVAFCVISWFIFRSFFFCFVLPAVFILICGICFNQTIKQIQMKHLQMLVVFCNYVLFIWLSCQPFRCSRIWASWMSNRSSAELVDLALTPKAGVGWATNVFIY